MNKQTKFEKDLEAYFPDIYKIHQLAKWDKYIWEAFYQMQQIADENAFAEVKIIYQAGRINGLYVTKKLTSRPVKKDGYAVSEKEK